MKTETISIPATLQTELILRLFILDYESEVKHHNGDIDDHYMGDHVMPDNFDYSSHGKIMDKIREITRMEKETGYLRNNNDIVIAYQVLYVSEITDDRSEYEHKNTSTKADGQQLTEKVFVFGQPIEIHEIQSLVDWVNSQKELDSNEREETGVWKQKGVSFYTPEGAAKVLEKDADLFLKIGEATFAALSNKENFKPYLPVVVSA
jgi:hypothetical protein